MPVPISVPADAITTSPVPVGAVPATDNVPPDTVVPPEYELAPVKITVPEFRTRTAPEPAIVPKKVPVLG